MYFVFHIDELFSYTYIQPQDSQDVFLDNKDVRKAFSKDVRSLPTTVWPNPAQESNFRMTLSVPQENLHSVEQLLAKDGLIDMIEKFITATNSCPQYVILYQSVLTPNSEKIIEASTKLQMHAINCKQTPFYLCVEESEEIYMKNDFNVKCEDITPDRRSSSLAKRMLKKISFQKVISKTKKIGETIRARLIRQDNKPIGM